MSLFSFNLPFVLAFIVGVLASFAVSYRKRYYVLKERSDNSISFQERKLEQLGIELAQARNKLRKAEAELSFLKNGGHESGIAAARMNTSSGMNPDTGSVKRHTPIERHETKTVQQLAEESRRSSDSTSSSVDAASIYNQNMATYQLAADYDITDIYSPKTVTAHTPDKPTYQPYVSCGYSGGGSEGSGSSDSGSSSSDSCSSSSND